MGSAVNQERPRDDRPEVVTDPIDVAAELSTLCTELTLEDLQDALSGGVLGRSTCTVNDPPYFAGSAFHSVTTRSLREKLLPKGFIKDDSGGYSRTISPDGGIAIVVASGDEFTGKYDLQRPERQPRTSRAKGPLTEAIIAENELQLDLPGLEVSPRAVRRQTWVFLIHYAGEGGATAELSLPCELDSESRIAKWRRRLIIVNAGGDGPDLTRPGTPDIGPDFDIDVLARVV